VTTALSPILVSCLKKVVTDNGFDQGLEPEGDWLVVTSTRCPLRVWLGTFAEVKARLHAAQQRAALVVNREMLGLYWQIGHDILAWQHRQGGGAGIVDKVATDPRAVVSAMKGFLRAKLVYMCAFAEAWPEADFVQQPVGQLLRSHKPEHLGLPRAKAAWGAPAAHRRPRPQGGG
jgi:hypothetical protein